MGGTFREMGIGANAADGNPAQLALVQAYQLEFAGGWEAKSNGWYVAGWARDSTNPDISGAYSLHYINNDLGGGARLAQWAHSLSLATRLGDLVSIGIGGRWLIQGTPRSINAASLNVGVAIRAAKTFTLGFAGYNLIDTHHPELSRSFEFGFSWLIGPVRLASEIRSDLGHGPIRPPHQDQAGGAEARQPKEYVQTGGGAIEQLLPQQTEQEGRRQGPKRRG